MLTFAHFAVQGASQRQKDAVRSHVASKLPEVCCARFERDGREECGRQYCAHHVRRQMYAKVARISRRMHEREDRTGERTTRVDARVGIELLDPSLHSVPECRNRSRHAAMGATAVPTEAECMGRSILHHLSRRYELDEAGVRRRMQAAGLDMGESVKSMAKVMGMFKEVRHTGNVRGTAAVSSRRERRSKDDRRRAGELLERFQRSRASASPSAGRRLAGVVTGSPHAETASHGIGQHMDEAGGLSRSWRNTTRTMARRMRALDLKAMKATTRHMNEQVSPQRKMDVHSLRSEQLKQAVGSPHASWMLLHSEHGTMTSRFYGAVTSVNSLRQRLHGALHQHRERTRVRRLAEGRRLQSHPAPTSALYDGLERGLAEARRRRRLDAAPGGAPATTRSQVLELPEEHALSWVHHLEIDWHGVRAEATRLFDVTRARTRMRAEGRLAHAAIVAANPTGWHYLDHPEHTRPSAVGDALRRLQHRIENDGADPPWHEPLLRRRVHRRLFHGSAEASETSTEGSPLHIRRMAEAFLEGTLAAPYAFSDTVLPTGTVVEQSQESFWKALLRYTISGTIGCYLTAPALEASDTVGASADGEPLRILRPSSEKLCFPACTLHRTRTLAPPTHRADDASSARAQCRLCCPTCSPSAS
tara:strand:- start:978 stop:2921 length:1944 start_codon:yes stop_codon:yes gene_type:complete